MSSRMVINTERTVAYNSKLWQATPSLKLGLGNDVNKETKKEGLCLMDGGSSKN